MAKENEAEWQPKTRDDWVGLFADGMKTGLSGFASEREEKEAKNPQTPETGEEKDVEPRNRSFADRLLGL